MFREETTSALAGFHAGQLSWSNWYLEGWFCRGRETEELGENPSEQGENQQQTQSHIAPDRHRTRATLVGGQASALTILPSPLPNLNKTGLVL